MNKVSASPPQDHGFKLHIGHNHDSLNDTSTVWSQEADSRVLK